MSRLRVSDKKMKENMLEVEHYGQVGLTVNSLDLFLDLRDARAEIERLTSFFSGFRSAETSLQYAAPEIFEMHMKRLLGLVHEATKAVLDGEAS